MITIRIHKRGGGGNLRLKVTISNGHARVEVLK